MFLKLDHHREWGLGIRTPTRGELIALGSDPDKVMASRERDCSVRDGRSFEGSTWYSWDFGKLWLNSEGGMSQEEGTQAWESTQPACCLDTRLLYYLFTYSLRGAQNWVDYTPQFLAHYIITDPHEALLFIILFCFVPFINHSWSHSPLQHRHPLSCI